MKLQALREIKNIPFSQKDSLVIFGEIFSRGYVEGLVRIAQSKGMNIIYSTMGRRDSDGQLRNLNEEERKSQPQNLINEALEAGFDMENSASGVRPIDLCREASLKNWENFQLDKILLEDSRKKSVYSFRERTKKWLESLEKKLPDQGHVVIAHTMAGGVPRTKILLPILNRVLKGMGHRFSSSKACWESELGWFCQQNFSEVTAQTYRHLLEMSTSLREKLEKQGRQLFYMAYSYHGTEILVGEQYRWQSYAPYLQGFAKLELENISKQFFAKGVKSYVFNVPEILTRSSAIFPGVEIPLYTILGALEKNGGENGKEIVSQCIQKMIDNAYSFIMNTTKEYFESKTIKALTVFKKWPQHNTPEQMELMLSTSRKLAGLNKDSSSSITSFLSNQIATSCGRLILQELGQQSSVHWIGHDLIARDVKERMMS